MRHHRMPLSSFVAMLPTTTFVVTVYLTCMAWTVFISFTSSKVLPNTNLVGLRQYERLLGTERWAVSVENIVIYGVLYILACLALGFVLAVFLDQKVRLENTLRTVFLFPYALSFIVTGAVWQWLFNPQLGLEAAIRRLGLEGFAPGIIANPSTAIYALVIAAVWQGTGLVMVMLLAGLRGIDEDIWKAARVDGIPMWKTYLFIVIPMMRPVFITTLVIIASGIVKVYDLVVAQTSGGPGISSEVPAKYVYDYMFQAQNLGQGFAASTMMLLSVLIVLIPWAYLEFGGKKHC